MRERGLQHPEPLFRPVLPFHRLGASELPRKLLKFYFTIAFYLVAAVAFSPANAGSYEDFFSAIQDG